MHFITIHYTRLYLSPSTSFLSLANLYSYHSHFRGVMIKNLHLSSRGVDHQCSRPSRSQKPTRLNLCISRQQNNSSCNFSGGKLKTGTELDAGLNDRKGFKKLLRISFNICSITYRMRKSIIKLKLQHDITKNKKSGHSLKISTRS